MSGCVGKDCPIGCPPECTPDISPPGFNCGTFSENRRPLQRCYGACVRANWEECTRCLAARRMAERIAEQKRRPPTPAAPLDVSAWGESLAGCDDEAAE